MICLATDLLRRAGFKKPPLPAKGHRKLLYGVAACKYYITPVRLVLRVEEG